MKTKKQSIKYLTQSAGRLYEVVAQAVSDLGGAARSIDTEDIAIRCHVLAPELFAWRKYPEQVNLELVRVSLSDAKKQKNGMLLSGTGRDGWRLTRKGLEWVSRRDQIPAAGGSSRQRAIRRTAGSIDTVRRAREIARIESSAAWATWHSEGQIDALDGRALFRVDSYATDRLVEIKVTRMLALFEPDSPHRRFLEAAANALKGNGIGHA